jgi:hypothetical protein
MKRRRWGVVARVDPPQVIHVSGAMVVLLKELELRQDRSRTPMGRFRAEIRALMRALAQLRVLQSRN